MRALIIDDERLAREELGLLLRRHPEIEVVGEAVNIREAKAQVESLRPDLVFLDIQMPGGSGFDLLEQLSPPHPRVIFTTAFDEYAVRAFEVNALDYLLKPIHPRRLAEALARVQTVCGEVAARPAVVAAPGGGAPALAENAQVFVREGERCWFVPMRSIRLIESVGNHTRLRFDHHAPLLYRTLGSIEERLPKPPFFRANRAQIINAEFIERLDPWFSNALKATLRGGEEVEFSRRAALEFRELTGL